ncbi:MAG: malate dehydrogenase [Thermodesulfobacteriaceae bacterium]|nr:malate dehydrogenase [Thermodesulfobacteriaceae bacterium]MCX7614030.1 malate dehydrogenase [Caldimicrobium sp.]MDW8136383.1 malate dehydrogenase [Thermodesulfobacterium sp.]
MKIKLSIIGAGAVGTSCAKWAMVKNLAQEVVLIDIVPDLAKGKALDLAQSSPLFGFSGKIWGTEDFSGIENSQIVIITAGKPRTPGMSREDLLHINKEIVKSCAEVIKRFASESIVIVVSNPLDAMVYVAYKVTGFPKNRVIGMAGTLDSARYRYFIAEALGVSPKDVCALVMGVHGDFMLPLTRLANVAGIPISELLSQEEIENIVRRTKYGGGEIVKYLKTGSAFITPGLATIEMVESILKDEKRVLTCSVYLEGEYGIQGVFLGVPVILGKNGIEKILEIKLTSEELEVLRKGAKHCEELIKMTHL